MPIVHEEFLQPIADSSPLEWATWGPGSGHWDRVAKSVYDLTVPPLDTAIYPGVPSVVEDVFNLGNLTISPPANAVDFTMVVDAYANNPNNVIVPISLRAGTNDWVACYTQDMLVGEPASWCGARFNRVVAGTSWASNWQLKVGPTPGQVPPDYIRPIIWAIYAHFFWFALPPFPITTGLKAVLDPHTRLTKVLFQQPEIPAGELPPKPGTFLEYRGLGAPGMAGMTGYSLRTDFTTGKAAGILHLAGRLYAYYHDTATLDNWACRSDLDGKEPANWSEDKMATVTAWDGYVALDVRLGDDGRTQHAVLYKSPNLCYSRNTRGDGTSWSAPIIIVNVGTTQPMAVVLAEPHAALRVYYQSGTASIPATLACSRIDGGGTWA